MPKFKKSTRGFKMKAGKEGPFKKNFPNDIGSPNKFLGGLIAKGVGKLAAKGIGKLAGKALGGGVGKALGGIGAKMGGGLFSNQMGGGGPIGLAVGGAKALIGRRRAKMAQRRGASRTAPGAALTKKSAYKKDDKKKYMSPQRQKIFKNMGMEKITKGYDPVTGEKRNKKRG
jgi:hypothetical protein